MTQPQFVRMVQEAFRTLGLTPMQGDFYYEHNGVRQACAVGAIVTAQKERVASFLAEEDWLGAAEVLTSESRDFLNGVTAGFDGDASAQGGPEFLRGVEAGRAAFLAVTQPELAAPTEPHDTAVPAPAETAALPAEEMTLAP